MSTPSGQPVLFAQKANVPSQSRGTLKVTASLPRAQERAGNGFGLVVRPASSTPLGGCGCWLQPCRRPWESAQAQRTRAGPTSEQQLQLTHYRKGGQADARTFGSSRSKVTNAWATDTRVTWWCQPCQERPSKWSRPSASFNSR